MVLELGDRGVKCCIGATNEMRQRRTQPVVSRISVRYRVGYSWRSAETTGRRAARIAGSRPPSKPMNAA